MAEATSMSVGDIVYEYCNSCKEGYHVERDFVVWSEVEEDACEVENEYSRLLKNGLFRLRKEQVLKDYFISLY